MKDDTGKVPEPQSTASRVNGSIEQLDKLAHDVHGKAMTIRTRLLGEFPGPGNDKSAGVHGGGWLDITNGCIRDSLDILTDAVNHLQVVLDEIG